MLAEPTLRSCFGIAGAAQRALVLMLVGLLWLGSPSAAAQCVPTWLPGEGIPGVSGAINSLVKYDDGTGEKLYAAGAFATAGTSTAARIAVWDGTEWQPLRSGLANTCFTLAVFNGKLYAGGDFNVAGGVTVERIASWDGTAWAALPGATFTGISRRPQAMVVFNNELIVAGTFANAGGNVANGIAAFNGTTWRSLGTGMTDNGDPAIIRALAVFNGELYATGSFDVAGGIAARNIAKWNGTQWSALTSGIDSTTGGYAVQVFGSELFVGGAFNNAGGIPSARAARWNGTQWSAAPVGTSGLVSSFGIHAGQLYAGGTFQFAGTNRGFARWNGSAFVAESTDLDSGGINAFATFDNDLIAAGSFLAINGLDVNRISRYAGALPWRTFGSGFNSPVRAIVSRPGELIIAGSFTTIDAKPIRHVVRWDGAAWSEVGTGGINSNNTSGVRTLIDFQGSLYAGGAFQNSANSSVPSMFARFDGTNWVKVGTAFGAGSGREVNATAIYNNQLVLAGEFTNLATNPDIDGIATWNGAVYSPIGTGLGGQVFALAVHNGELYAGGAITSAGGNTAIDNIAKWNGTTWSAVGQGLNNYVFALYSWNGSLYAGGQFSGSGGTSFVGLARWDGATWSAVGGSMTAGSVMALGEFNGSLVAFGDLRKTVGGDTFSRVALWSGSVWSGFGTGLSGNAAGVAPFAGAIGVLNGELYIGSDALSAGGKISAYLAHWGSLEPCIQSSPIPGSICRGGDFTFNVAATGKPALRYQWRRAEVDLLNANGPSYTVMDASEDDEGLYDCVIENDFGTATSGAALLQLCVSDLDCSGTVDDADFSVFVVAYDLLDCADPSMAPECPADLNRDAVVDDLDFSIFVVAYDVLLCP
jgi:trimeric autotransporter adhesin